MEIATEYTNTLLTNYLFGQIFGLNQTNENLEEDDIYINIQEEMDVATDIDALINMVAGKLLGGEISNTLRTEIRGMLERVPEAGCGNSCGRDDLLRRHITRIRAPAVSGEGT